MICVFNSGLSCPGSSTDQGHRVVFLNKIFALRVFPFIACGVGTTIGKASHGCGGGGVVHFGLIKEFPLG